MYCFLLHIFISFNPRTTHQISQSQTMQVWTHLRPRSPLHTSLDLLSALPLNHGHSRASPAIWLVGEEKGGGDYFTGYCRNLISNCIVSMKAKTKCCQPLWFFFYLFTCYFCKLSPLVSTPNDPPTHTHTHLPIHFLKLNLRIGNPLLLHYKCTMHRKHRIGRIEVDLLEI